MNSHKSALFYNIHYQKAKVRLNNGYLYESKKIKRNGYQ